MEKYRAGEVSAEDVVSRFQAAPLENLGFAMVDTHRALRKGFPEVIFGSGKTPEHTLAIAKTIYARDHRVLITRVSDAQAAAVLPEFPHARHLQPARCIVIEEEPLPKNPGVIAIVCAGTTDIPVAEEAATTAEIMGNTVEKIFDAGVAGLHRILSRLEQIQKANVVVVAAGMEGALPSVVAGLVSRPVIAVPTSVGYGANLGGLAALLGMLNSCGSGVTVVNIDNGFGAGYAASQINALAAHQK